jgi:hypothetical protein
MPDVRRLWPKSPQSATGQVNVNGFLLALGLDEPRVEELGARYRSGASATVDLRGAGASTPSKTDRLTASVLIDGSEEEIRAYLESIFGTPAFHLSGAEIHLDLPVLGDNGRPHSVLETVNVRFRAPRDWRIQRPAADRQSHAVPEDSVETFCGLSTIGWLEPVEALGEMVSCPLCRARMIAIEIAAPPAEGDTDRPTLHEEVARILRESSEEWLTTDELARRINAASRYAKGDQSPVTGFQIHGRTRNYPHVFDRQGSRVRLRPPTS